jgi:HEAT repeat protein
MNQMTIRLATYIGMVVLILIGGCDNDDARDRARCIDWANRYPLVVDEWRSEYFDEEFDLDAWIAEGGAIENIEPTLVELLDEGDERIETPIVLIALGYLGSSKSASEIRPYLRDGWDLNRTYAVFALGNLEDTSSLHEIGRLLSSDPSMHAREIAATALVRIGGPEAKGYLEAAVEKEVDDSVRMQIRDALREVKEKLDGG